MRELAKIDKFVVEGVAEDAFLDEKQAYIHQISLRIE